MLALAAVPLAPAAAQAVETPAAQDAQLQALVAECESCHGPGGVSTEADVPSLAGQSATYLRELLDQFYYYERHCPTTTYRHGDRPKTPLNMCNVANTLSEQEKAALAEFFSSRELP
jgi:sulfide dehydrogenase cytochrome subunit